MQQTLDGEACTTLCMELMLSMVKGKNFDNERANKVIKYVRKFLDEVVPLTNISWNEVSKIKINNGNIIFLTGDKENNLKNKRQFIGYNGEKNNPSSILIKNNNLHIDILIDSNNVIGKTDKASISDIVVESAVSTIIDNEDSVAAVDAEDKVKCYRNWLGLMKGEFNS